MSVSGMPSPAEQRAQGEGPWSATLRAPFATLAVRTGGDAVTHVAYLPHGAPKVPPRNALAEEALRQLERYLEDATFEFDLPLAPAGTAFRQRVWEAIAGIPRGESRTYGELARGLHTAPRAVGGACGANPIALIIPCHRVIGSQGYFGGFMNAVDGDPLAIKRWLLRHEGYRFGA